MKRNLFLLAALLSSAYASFAQTNATVDPYELQQKVYNTAMKHYDLQTATVALHQMMAMKPAKTELNDSLAMLYFAQDRYPQAYLIGEEILKANPEKATIREMVAVSKQNMGMIKESLAEYEKLYEQQKSLFYMYQIATLQYQLKRFGECIASLDQIIADKDADAQKVNIRMQQGTQDVPMKAAAYNVKGICATELNQAEAAKTNFTKAIELFPDFALAKGNLENLNKAITTAPVQAPAAGGATKAAPAPKKSN